MEIEEGRRARDEEAGINEPQTNTDKRDVGKRENYGGFLGIFDDFCIFKLDFCCFWGILCSQRAS